MIAQRCRFRSMATPWGEFCLVHDSQGQLLTCWDRNALPVDAVEDDALEPSLVAQLTSYLAHGRAHFDWVPTPDGPHFFRRCWDACRAIAPGETLTYAELALAAGGTPHAARAAGQAMRRNHLPIIIPCHRVVGATGGLHGYAGSQEPDGLPLRRKAGLLALERAAVGASTGAATLT